MNANELKAIFEKCSRSRSTAKVDSKCLAGSTADLLCGDSAGVIRGFGSRLCGWECPWGPWKSTGQEGRCGSRIRIEMKPEDGKTCSLNHWDQLQTVYLWHLFMVLFSVMMCHDVSWCVMMCHDVSWCVMMCHLKSLNHLHSSAFLICGQVRIFGSVAPLCLCSHLAAILVQQISEIVTAAASAASHIFIIFSLCDGVRNVLCNVLWPFVTFALQRLVMAFSICSSAFLGVYLWVRSVIGRPNANSERENLSNLSNLFCRESVDPWPNQISKRWTRG